MKNKGILLGLTSQQARRGTFSSVVIIFAINGNAFWRIDGNEVTFYLLNIRRSTYTYMQNLLVFYYAFAAWFTCFVFSSVLYNRKVTWTFYNALVRFGKKDKEGCKVLWMFY